MSREISLSKQYKIDEGSISAAWQKFYGRADENTQFIEKDQLENRVPLMKLVSFLGTEYLDESGCFYLLRFGDISGLEMGGTSENWVIEIPSAMIPDEVAKLMVLIDENITLKLNDEDFRRVKEIFILIEDSNDWNDVLNEKMKIHLTCSLILFLLSRIDENF